MTNTVSWHCKMVAKFLEPKSEHAMISINSPGQTSELKTGWNDVLKLEFHDVGRYANQNAYTIFDETMANRIIDFIEERRTRIRHFHIHCFAGLSRSAAVAKFMKKTYGMESKWGGAFYNRHVMYTLCRTYEKRRKNAE